MPVFAFAITDEEVRAQITELLSQFSAIQAQLQAADSAPQSTPPIHQSTLVKTINTIADANPKLVANVCAALSRTLTRGARGEDVATLQRFLVAQGLLSPDSATGYFGAMTEAAVRQWQVKNNIVLSGDSATTGFGAVGARTRAAIAARCKGLGASVGASMSGLVATVNLTLNTNASCAAATYALDFGDGVVQSIPVASGSCAPLSQSIAHTYAYPGSYNLRVTSGDLVVSLALTISGGAQTQNCVAPEFNIPSISGTSVGYSFWLPVLTYRGTAPSMTVSGLPTGITLRDTLVSATSTTHAMVLAGSAQASGTFVVSLGASNSCGRASASISIPVSGSSVTSPVSTVNSCPIFQTKVCPAGSHLGYLSADNLCNGAPSCLTDTTPVPAICSATNVVPIVTCAQGFTLVPGGADSNGCPLQSRCAAAGSGNTPSNTSNFSVSPSSGVAPINVSFSGTVNSAGYSIDFGDGATSGNIGCTHGGCPATSAQTNVNITHTYTSSGSYTAKLRRNFSIVEGNCFGVDCNVVGTVTITVTGGASLSSCPNYQAPLCPAGKSVVSGSYNYTTGCWEAPYCV